MDISREKTYNNLLERINNMKSWILTNLEKRYKELITERANKYIKEQIGEDKQFMPEDTYHEMYELLYNAFVSGVNASREVLIIINQEKEHE